MVIIRSFESNVPGFSYHNHLRPQNLFITFLKTRKDFIQNKKCNCYFPNYLYAKKKKKLLSKNMP